MATVSIKEHITDGMSYVDSLRDVTNDNWSLLSQPIDNTPFAMFFNASPRKGWNKTITICASVLAALATFAQDARQFEPMEYDGLPYQQLACSAKRFAGIPLYVTVGSRERTADYLSDFTSEIKDAGGTVEFDFLSGCSHPEACSKAFTAKRLNWIFSQRKTRRAGK